MNIHLYDDTIGYNYNEIYEYHCHNESDHEPACVNHHIDLSDVSHKDGLNHGYST